MHEMGGGQGERGALGTAQLSAPREEHPAKLSSVWGGGGGGARVGANPQSHLPGEEFK